MNKTYHLTINNQLLTLTLTPPPSWGYCVGCFKQKEIRVTSKQPNQFRRKFCRSCALSELDKLWDCKFENQAQIIKELRQFLVTDNLEKEQLLECYG